MGLNLSFQSLTDYLFEHVDETHDVEHHVARVKGRILAAIASQTGSIPDLTETAPREVPEGFKFGAYSEIHVLRVFAARVSGYRLSEIYDMPLSTDATEADANVETTVDVADSARDEEETDAEASVEEDWGIRLERIVPLPVSRREPFPFLQLVNFSDSEGIYLPIAFREPMLFDGLFVGSSAQLLEELEEVGVLIAEALTHSLQLVDPDPRAEQFLAYVRDLHWRLRTAADTSVRSKVSLVFC